MASPLSPLLWLRCYVLAAGFLAFATDSGTRPESVQVKAELARSLRTVSPRFLSVALDASLLRQKGMDLLRSQKLITLAKALSPGYLRFGGTGADFILFEQNGHPFSSHENSCMSPKTQDDCLSLLPSKLESILVHVWRMKAPHLLKEKFNKDIQNITITGESLDILYTFAHCSGLHLIFGLNALLRKDHAWDSSNAQKLLQYCASKQYNMSWELGNEPNSFRHKAGIKVPGTQLGKDFQQLYSLLHIFKTFNHTKLYGPDIGQPRRRRIVTMLKGFLQTGGEVLDAVTWHHYYVNGRNATPEEFLSPKVLDSLVWRIKQILKVVAKSVPGKKVWLGETSSAFGGGAPDLSNKFIAGFMRQTEVAVIPFVNRRFEGLDLQSHDGSALNSLKKYGRAFLQYSEGSKWLDKLGLSAKMGIDVVIRQVLVGAAYYQLVDWSLDPLPDYWLSLIYKQLVGTKVLNVSASHSDKGNEGTLRVYMHCTNPTSEIYRKGAVTMFALNLSTQDKEILLFDPFNNIIQFLLQPGDSEEGLHSQSVKLNGQLLKMVDHKTLPDIKGEALPAGHPIIVPAHSYAFYVVQDANAPACL